MCTSCCKTQDLHVLSINKNTYSISHSECQPAVMLAGLWFPFSFLAARLKVRVPHLGKRYSPRPGLSLLLLVILASDSSLSCSLRSPLLWPCQHAGARCSCSVINSPLIPKSQRESVPSFPDLFFSSAGAGLIITGLLFCTSKIAQKMLQKTKLYCIETENNFRIE